MPKLRWSAFETTKPATPQRSFGASPVGKNRSPCSSSAQGKQDVAIPNVINARASSGWEEAFSARSISTVCVPEIDDDLMTMNMMLITHRQWNNIIMHTMSKTFLLFSYPRDGRRTHRMLSSYHEPLLRTPCVLTCVLFSLWFFQQDTKNHPVDREVIMHGGLLTCGWLELSS